MGMLVEEVPILSTYKLPELYQIMTHIFLTHPDPEIFLLEMFLLFYLNILFYNFFL